jgi:single-strand DNA-binding protein
MATARVTLIGRIGALKTIPTKTGEQAVIVTMAVTESWKNDAGVRQERTDWFDFTAFNAKATFVQRYLRKGQTMTVTGLKAQTYRETVMVDGNSQARTNIRLQTTPQTSFDNIADPRGTGMSPPPAASEAANQNAPADDMAVAA